MKTSLLLHLLFLSLIPVFSSCGQSGAAKSDEIVLEEKTRNYTEDVVLTDKTDEEQKSQQDFKVQPTVAPAEILADKSEVVTMFDGYGNKTQTRYFKGHPRIQLVIIRTAVSGMKQVMVYGYGSDSKIMSEEFAEKALTASAAEIANAAELKTARPYKDAFVRTTATPPMSPVQIRQSKTVQPVQPNVEPPAQTSGDEEKNNADNQSVETQNRRSNEENQR